MKENSKLAYGALGLKPDEFYRLTPGQFYDMMEGYAWRADQRMQEMAWALSNLMNCWTKKRITPRKLLKRSGQDEHEKEASVERIIRKLAMQKAKKDRTRGKNKDSQPLSSPRA